MHFGISLAQANFQCLYTSLDLDSKENNKMFRHSVHVGGTQREKSIPAIINLLITCTPAPTQKLADARAS